MLHRIAASLRQFIFWLGPGRTRFIFLLLAFTGLGSLMLNTVQPPEAWVTLVQSLLAVAFLVGAAGAVVTRFSGPERRQALLLIGPAVLAFALGLLFPSLFIVMALAAVGWLVIASITSRAGVRREYQRAIRHLRKAEYDQAIQVMDELIQAEPQQADHFRFRAELYRLSGKPKKARADYEKVIALTPESGVGYNGLAEVYLQIGEYRKALTYGQQALEREPLHWVAAYNLGMIEDRLNMPSEALMHLDKALGSGIPDSRHRLLAQLWIARAATRRGDGERAARALEQMKSERIGLREWTAIFESKEAAVLRNVLAEDVALAARLIEGTATLDSLEGAAMTLRADQDVEGERNGGHDR